LWYPRRAMPNPRRWIRTLLLLVGGAVVLLILGFVLFMLLYAWADIH